LNSLLFTLESGFTISSDCVDSNVVGEIFASIVESEHCTTGVQALLDLWKSSEYEEMLKHEESIVVALSNTSKQIHDQMLFKFL
jgi:hypothetical protein